MFVPILGFAPDLDPSTPGAVTDCDLMMPTIKGMKALPGETDAGFPDISANCQGITQLLKLDNTSRLIAGTSTKLYEGATNAWSDVSRASSAYSVGLENRWRFAQFGDVSLAAGTEEPLQFSNSSGAFDDVSGAPKCSIVETVGDFVMVFDTDDSTTSTVYGNQGDRWWCSALGTYDSWTPSIASQSATGRLTETPGPIRAGKRLGDRIIAYKERSMYLGTYIDPPLVWSWVLIPGEVGALTHESVISIETAHYFIGYEDIYMFDGTRPVSIAENRVREWFFGDLDDTFKWKIYGVHDRRNFTVFWYYPSSTSGGALDSYIAYNYRSKKWGYGKKTVRAALEYGTGGTTYDGLGSLYSTYDDLPTDVTYDSQFWTAYTPNHAIVDNNNDLKLLTAAAGSSNITTWDMGKDDIYHLITRVRPRFITTPTTGTQTHYQRDTLGDTKVTGDDTTLVDGKFDHVFSGRWQSYKHAYTGDVEFTGLDVDQKPDSYE